MKPIPEYEEFYSITKDGMVWANPSKTHKGKWLATRVYKLGYVYVGLWNRKLKKQKWISVHRLVAKAYIKNPKNLPQVNHKNGIKIDNRVKNLEWVTCQQNHKHAWKTGLKVFTEKHEKARAKNSILGGIATRKLTLNQVAQIKKKHARGEPQYLLAKEYGISKAAMCRLINNKSYRCAA